MKENAAVPSPVLLQLAQGNTKTRSVNYHQTAP